MSIKSKQCQNFSRATTFVTISAGLSSVLIFNKWMCPLTGTSIWLVRAWWTWFFQKQITLWLSQNRFYVFLRNTEVINQIMYSSSLFKSYRDCDILHFGGKQCNNRLQCHTKISSIYVPNVGFLQSTYQMLLLDRSKIN